MIESTQPQVASKILDELMESQANQIEWLESKGAKYIAERHYRIAFHKQRLQALQAAKAALDHADWQDVLCF